jgi:hypothetical protein
MAAEIHRGGAAAGWPATATMIHRDGAVAGWPGMTTVIHPAMVLL